MKKTPEMSEAVAKIKTAESELKHEKVFGAVHRRTQPTIEEARHSQRVDGILYRILIEADRECCQGGGFNVECENCPNGPCSG